MSPINTEYPDSGAWKDQLGMKALTGLAHQFAKVYKPFDVDSFQQAVLADGFLERELKDRVNVIARHLRRFLPRDYDKATRLLIKVAPKVGGFENWALTSFVEQFGLEQFDASVDAMQELTKHGTAEFAIRPYMIQYTQQMLPVLDRWAGDENEHVRRLAAEGSRPRGVWVAHIDSFRKDPQPVIKLLEKLKADPSLYVRKAVANNLNDISRDHPELVIKTALKWVKKSNPHTDWIVKHACRSLIKQGRPEVFPVFGFDYPPIVAVDDLKLSPRRVKIGGELSFDFAIASKSRKPQRLAVDYIVYYRKANGKTSPKVFKLCERTVESGQRLLLEGRRSFVERSTRKHHPGAHHLEIQVNGLALAKADFALIK